MSNKLRYFTKILKVCSIRQISIYLNFWQWSQKYFRCFFEFSTIYNKCLERQKFIVYFGKFEQNVLGSRTKQFSNFKILKVCSIPQIDAMVPTIFWFSERTIFRNSKKYVKSIVLNKLRYENSESVFNSTNPRTRKINLGQGVIFGKGPTGLAGAKL